MIQLPHSPPPLPTARAPEAMLTMIKMRILHGKYEDDDNHHRHNHHHHNTSKQDQNLNLMNKYVFDEQVRICLKG